MAITVGFSCGCLVKVPETRSGGDPPTCVLHPHARVARVATRAPSITGTASGPHVKTQAMSPAAPTLRSGEALRLKQPKTE